MADRSRDNNDDRRPSRIGRVVAVASVSLVAIGVGVGLVATAGGAGSSPAELRSTVAKLSIFDRASADTDRLPRAARDEAYGEVRRVGPSSYAGMQFWLATNKEEHTLCLVTQDRDRATSSGCERPTRAIRPSGWSAGTASTGLPPFRFVAFGVVPDGFRCALVKQRGERTKNARVRRNAYAVSLPKLIEKKGEAPKVTVRFRKRCMSAG